ncbi:MAG: DUF502 domain-containing protein [Candidatus Omnitrophica bacterium]|nr:DUF502 domain-containing protein [Candidatus Omnitrophota bacterium]
MKITTRIRNDFITGIAIVLPIAVTIMVLNLILTALNSALLEPIVKGFEPYATGPYVSILAKVIIFLVILSAVTLVGVAARIIFIRKFFTFWEGLFLKVPMVNKIYKGTKQMSRAFLGEGKTIFKKVALIEYPRKGIYSIAFVTTAVGKKELSDKSGRELVSLFLPTTPNPTSGMFIAVPKEDVIFLDMSIEDGFKLVISSGAV